jgi:DNA-binding beta-propeller fold protein YncE
VLDLRRFPRAACLALIVSAASLLAATSAAAATFPTLLVTNLVGSTVSQYDVGPDGLLTPKDPPIVAAGGSLPLGIDTTPDGRYAFVAAAGAEKVQRFEIGATGLLSPQGPAATMGKSSPELLVSSDGKSLFVSDENKHSVLQFDIGAGGALTPKTPPSVPAGPTPTAQTFSLATTPSGGNVYAANLSESTISQYGVLVDGSLAPLTPATVPTGENPAKMTVSPDGRSLYVPNSSDDTVSQFTIGLGGTLVPKVPATVATGKEPFGIAVTPDGLHAFVTDGGESAISQYDVAPDGALVPENPPTVATGPKPANVVVSPDGRNVYIPLLEGEAIAQFSVVGGQLVRRTPSTVPAGQDPIGAVFVTPPEVVPPAATPKASPPPPPPSVLAKGRLRFGKLTRNSAKGTAQLLITTSGAGTVTAAKSKAVAGSHARAKQAGVVHLLIKARGKALKKLVRTGKATVTAKVTFALDGGAPTTVSKAVGLIEHPPAARRAPR